MSDNESGNGQNEQWDVEEIVGRRVKKGRTEYFVKWTGYNEEDNTWEPVDNLDCAEKIAEFEAKAAAEQAKSETIKPSTSGPKSKKTKVSHPSSASTSNESKTLDSIKSFLVVDKETLAMCEFTDGTRDMISVKVLKKEYPSLLIDTLEGLMVGKLKKNNSVAGTSQG